VGGGKKKDGKKSGKKADKAERKSGKKSGEKSGKQAKLATCEARPAVDDVDVRLRELQQRVGMVQDQFVGVVAALGESTDRLQAAVALIADLPTPDAATDSARELRQRLEQMLVAQQRTNELLDLALGVAVEPDPRRAR
jgi:cell division protein ZapA (FtsZ GTPase activity inhibitor)